MHAQNIIKNGAKNYSYYSSIHSTTLPSTGSGWAGVEHSGRTELRLSKQSLMLNSCYF